MVKKASWLFTDVPVYKEGDGKKARWFVELNDNVTIEVKPVSGLVLWMLYRTYLAQLPDPPVVELELEGVAAVQRTRDDHDQEYRAQVTRIFTELDMQLTEELLGGVVVPENDDWTKPWTDKGRPLPPKDDPVLWREFYLTMAGLQTYDDRQMLIRAIDAISQETQAAVERAQQFFRYYVGRDKAAFGELAGNELTDDAEGRDSVGDAELRHDGEAVVQVVGGRTGDDVGPATEHAPEGILEQPGRKGSKRRKAS